MNQQNSRNRKKKKGGGLWGLLAAFIIIFNMLASEVDGRDFDYYLWRLRHNPTLLAVIVGVVIVVVIVAVSLAIQKAKGVEDKPTSRGTAAQRGGAPAQHSHDRIQGYTTGAESGYMHWKKQLDGFLAAGLIDRKEYMALLERRKDNY